MQIEKYHEGDQKAMFLIFRSMGLILLKRPGELRNGLMCSAQTADEISNRSTSQILHDPDRLGTDDGDIHLAF